MHFLRSNFRMDRRPNRRRPHGLRAVALEPGFEKRTQMKIPVGVFRSAAKTQLTAERVTLDEATEGMS